MLILDGDQLFKIRIKIMFNGIIFNTGKVKKLLKKIKKVNLIAVKTNLKLKKKDIGSSICCDGVCLT